MVELDRRALMGGMAGGMAALWAASPALAQVPQEAGAAQDEAYWAQIAALYDQPAGVIQLEHGNWTPMARPVMQAYERRVEALNRDTSYYARRSFAQDFLPLRARVAAKLNVAPEEIAFTRNTTEALQALIGGYTRLRASDAVLIADTDYDAAQAGMRWLARRQGAGLVEIAMPEPATYQGVIDAYDAALKAHPQVRLMLLTHISHRNGLVAPVKEILALAKARGVDVILDGSHAWGQMELDLADFGAEFVALNCHKWIGAPLGVGLAVIRRHRLDAIAPNMCEEGEGTTAASRVHTGTTNIAALMGLSDALDLHDRLTAKAKGARLAYLRRRWTESLRGLHGIEVIAPEDPRLTCALGAFRLTGRTSMADNRALAKRLLEEHRIFTVERAGLAKGGCIRVTPGLMTKPAEVDALVTALKALA